MALDDKVAGLLGDKRVRPEGGDPKFTPQRLPVRERLAREATV
jgi:hypothetical protein